MVERETILFYMLFALAAGKQYPDNVQSRFPRLFHLDDYHRCLSKSDGLYCLGTFELSPKLYPQPIYEFMKKYSEDPFNFNRTRIHRGYCVSDRCNTTIKDKHFHLLRFEDCVDRSAQKHMLRAHLIKLEYCKTHDEKHKEKDSTTQQKLFLNIVYAFFSLNLMATAYDVLTSDKERKNKLITAWSLLENWRRLTGSFEHEDLRLNALAPLQGLRVVALLFTMYAHSNVLHYMFYTINPQELETQTRRADGIFLSNGTSLTQAFIMISSFLTCYNLLIYSQKHDLSLKLLPLCIVKRVIRILPVHVLVVGYASTWWIETRDGPLTSSTIGLEAAACAKKFWYHVFFVNNIFDKTEHCIVPTWFFPVDMHLYILACALTLVLWKQRTKALKLYIILTILCSVINAVLSFINGYKSMVYMSTPEQIRRIFRDDPSYTHFYTSSWGALPACFLGLIMAHVQFEIDERKIKLADYKLFPPKMPTERRRVDLKHLKCRTQRALWFVYLHYFLYPVMYVWGLTGIPMRNFNSQFVASVYIAVERPLFCIIIAINLLGCFNINTPMKKMFEWKVWQFLARMSLTIMILHWCINMTIACRPVAYYTTVFDAIVDWAATFVMTCVLAVPITVLVEIPMQRFLNIIFF